MTAAAVPAASDGVQTRQAVAAGVGCYVIWGLIPLVFQAVGRTGPSPWEIMIHRVIWGMAACLLLTLAARKFGEVAVILRTPRTLAWLTLSAVLIAANWTMFVWAVNSGHTLQTALGYYLTPLVSMAAGAVLFYERIGMVGKIAAGLAAIGVVIQAIALGHPPYIALFLTVTFGSYGIVRKHVRAEALPGLFVECLVLLPFALAGMVWLQHTGQGHFSHPAAAAWLIACGPLTAAPLALFSWAARRIPLSTMGFLQFIGPTLSFFVGVAEGESFGLIRAISFAFMWSGAAVFLWGVWRNARAVRTAVLNAEPC